jgi:hypothetical protein
MLQPSTWQQINGDTVVSSLEAVLQHLPVPVSIQHLGHELVVLDFDEWKRRMLRLQGADE